MATQYYSCSNCHDDHPRDLPCDIARITRRTAGRRAGKTTATIKTLSGKIDRLTKALQSMLPLGHTRWCSYDVSGYGEDFCTCDLRGRRELVEKAFK